MSKPKVLILHPRDWARNTNPDARFEYHHIYIGGPVPRKIVGRITYDGYAEVVTDWGVEELLRAVKELQPKLFLFWIHSGFKPTVLSTIKQLCPKMKICMWYGNHRHSVPHGVRMYAPYVDMVFINSKDERQYKMYKTVIKHVGTLYDGFNPAEVELSTAEPEFDCTFGGNSYLPQAQANEVFHFPGGLLRYNLITAVHKHFKLGVFSDNQRGWPFPCLDPVYHPEYTNALRRGRITLNVNHYPELYKAYTRRTIRSIFAGRLHLTFYIPGMEEDFGPNKTNLVWFHDTKEALVLIRYYLDHPDEREEIAARGLAHARAKFTFDDRLRDFEKAVEVLL